MFKNKKAKQEKPVERKKEHYIPQITREPIQETKPQEEKKPTVSDGFKETVGYHRSPSYYDTIRGKAAPKKDTTPTYEEEIPVEEEIVEEVEEEIPEYTEFDLDEEIKNAEEKEDDYSDVYEEISYEEETPIVEEPKQEKIEERKEEKPVIIEPKKEEKKPLIKPKKKHRYVPPKLEFLTKDNKAKSGDDELATRQAEIINRTFREANIGAEVVKYIFGPTVTQFLIKVNPGVNVRVINNVESNLTMYLETERIRIQTPIPGKSFAGIEVPRKPEQRRNVMLGDMLSSKEFRESSLYLPIAVGQDNYGTNIYADIVEMPHALVAGTTKSGKSVCLNVIILSLLYRFSPDELQLILIDPKRIELGLYEGIPHLVMPVITDPEYFPFCLSWIVEEMERRYIIFEEYGDHNLQDLNKTLEEMGKPKIPYIVTIMDEFSDWIIEAGAEAENMLQKIAQKARAAGIHIILAAQRPSKDVIKGSIKANFDTRFAFKVSSFDDARVILGGSGAENLEGRGDMLLRYAGQSDKRLQGAFVSSGDIKRIINYLKENNTVDYLVTKEELKQSTTQRKVEYKGQGRTDPCFEEVAYYIVRNNVGSNNQIMQQFGMGFNRVTDIFNALEELGVVSKVVKGKPREVLVDEYQLTEILENE